MQARIVAAAHGHGMRLLGPNSMGVINPPAAMACSVNAALAAETLPVGRWSLVSQSGSVMGTLLSRAAARGFGFAKIVGTGNEADLSAGEVADLLVDDPGTDAILLFLETIRGPEHFERAARRAHASGRCGGTQAGSSMALQTAAVEVGKWRSGEVGAGNQRAVGDGWVWGV